MEEVLDAEFLEGDYLDFRPAKLNRILGSLIDGIVIFLFWITGFCMTMLFEDHYNTLNWFIMVAPFFIEPIGTSLGGSIGQRLMGLRVVQFEPFVHQKTKLNISIWRAIYRYFLKLLLGWKSFITVFFGSYSRSIHDLHSKSILIKS